MAVMVLIIALVPIVACDLRRRIIPDAVTGPAALVAACCAVALGGRPWWSPVASGVLVGLPLLVPALVRPDGMGMGDVKLAALMGVAMGAVPGLLAVLGGLVAAGAWGLVLALVRGARPGTIGLPLAPFLAAGVLCVIGPAALVHSPRGTGDDHPPAAAAAVRPADVRGGDGRGHPALAGRDAGAGAGHGCRPGPCGGAPAR